MVNGDEVQGLEDQVLREIEKLCMPEPARTEVLAEAREVAKAITGKQYTAKEIVREGHSNVVEHNGPTVLVSVSDPQRAEMYRAMFRDELVAFRNCSDFGELMRYVSERKSKRFHLIGVIGESDQSESAQRIQALEEIIGHNTMPAVFCLRSGPNPRVGWRGIDQMDPSRIPRGYHVVSQVLQRVHGISVVATEDTPHDGTRVRIGVFERIIRDEPGNVGALCDAAMECRSMSKYGKAIQYYNRALEESPGHLGAIIGRAETLMHPDARNNFLTSFSYGDSKGVQALLRQLRERASHANDARLDYLAGKAIVLLYLEEHHGKRSKATDIEQWRQERLQGKAILDDAIRHLQIAHSRNRTNVDAAVYLAVAHVLKRTKQDRHRAYDLISSVIEFSDPLTERLASGSMFELAAWHDLKEAAGSKLLQLTGLHRVLGLGMGDFVVKKFEYERTPGAQRWERKGEGRRARLERRNIAYYNQHRNRLEIGVPGREEKLCVPSWSYLVYKIEKDGETGTKRRSEFIFEIMPRLPGENVADLLEHLNELGNHPDMETRKQAAAIKLSHLEWIVDSTAKLQHVGTFDGDHPRKGLKNLREKKDYEVQTGDGLTERVGHYVSRVFEKIVETFERYRSPKEQVHLSGKQRSRLVRILRPVEDTLLSAPDWMFVAYVDANPKNNLAQPRTEQHPRDDEYVNGSTKSKVDFENMDRRLGIGDALTSIEHELAAGLTGPDQRYLMRRWYAQALLKYGPRPEPGKQTQAHGLLQTRIQHLDSKGDRKKELIHGYLKDYRKAVPSVPSQNQFGKLVRYESMFRHLTIYGDKLKERYLIGQAIEDIEKKYEHLKGWKPLRSFKQERKYLQEKGKHNTPEFLYALLNGTLEDLAVHAEYHKNKFLRMVRQTGQRELEKFMSEVYKLR
ncbi:hypothetical protein HY489_04275 [Candidatus Woesearchaeota archaeon]|nr:hypothetical protein [Candidatus Woesearchaeota archaeon]